MLKILGSSANRSDYDLMSGVYRALAQHPDVDFRLLVSGAHLDPAFGKTFQLIREDGLPILAELETSASTDSKQGQAERAGRLLQLAAKPIEDFGPDAILIPGDREDAIALALLGTYLRRATVHFFAGDQTTGGHLDNPVRHATAKLTSFHFVTHEEHKKRLERIGEQPENIFVAGSPQLDRFRTEPAMARRELLMSLGINDDPGDYAVITHHPVPGGEREAGLELKTLVTASLAEGLYVVANSPNVDPGARALLEVLETYRDHDRVCLINGLSRPLFVNLLRHATVLLGNSSMGPLEAASVPLAVIDVGPRQRGRLSASNVVRADPVTASIRRQLQKVRGDAFQGRLADVSSPYGDGHSVDRIVEQLLTLDYTGDLGKAFDPLTVPFRPE